VFSAMSIRKPSQPPHTNTFGPSYETPFLSKHFTTVGQTFHASAAKLFMHFSQTNG
jgi:hypothetical protein